MKLVGYLDVVGSWKKVDAVRGWQGVGAVEDRLDMGTVGGWRGLVAVGGRGGVGDVGGWRGVVAAEGWRRVDALLLLRLQFALGTRI